MNKAESNPSVPENTPNKESLEVISLEEFEKRFVSPQPDIEICHVDDETLMEHVTGKLQAYQKEGFRAIEGEPIQGKLLFETNEMKVADSSAAAFRIANVQKVVMRSESAINDLLNKGQTTEETSL